MNRAAWLLLAVCGAGVSTGCVTRRVLITSDPPGAIVYRNGQYLGPTPVGEPFIYYGKYHYRLVHDGYETLDISPELVAPWYELPGLDFISENLIPFPFRDVKRLHFPLQPEQPVRLDDIRARAEGLRQQGAQIQPAPTNPPAPVRPAPRPAPLPPPTPVVPPATTLPSVPPVTVPSPTVERSPGAP